MWAPNRLTQSEQPPSSSNRRLRLQTRQAPILTTTGIGSAFRAPECCSSRHVRSNKCCRPRRMETPSSHEHEAGNENGEKAIRTCTIPAIARSRSDAENRCDNNRDRHGKGPSLSYVQGQLQDMFDHEHNHRTRGYKDKESEKNQESQDLADGMVTACWHLLAEYSDYAKSSAIANARIGFQESW